jgi:hypothetical protein
MSPEHSRRFRYCHNFEFINFLQILIDNLSNLTESLYRYDGIDNQHFNSWVIYKDTLSQSKPLIINILRHIESASLILAFDGK